MKKRYYLLIGGLILVVIIAAIAYFMTKKAVSPAESSLTELNLEKVTGEKIEAINLLEKNRYNFAEISANELAFLGTEPSLFKYELPDKKQLEKYDLPEELANSEIEQVQFNANLTVAAVKPLNENRLGIFKLDGSFKKQIILKQDLIGFNWLNSEELIIATGTEGEIKISTQKSPYEAETVIITLKESATSIDFLPVRENKVAVLTSVPDEGNQNYYLVDLKKKSSQILIKNCFPVSQDAKDNQAAVSYLDENDQALMKIFDTGGNEVDSVELPQKGKTIKWTGSGKGILIGFGGAEGEDDKLALYSLESKKLKEIIMPKSRPDFLETVTISRILSSNQNAITFDDNGLLFNLYLKDDLL